MPFYETVFVTRQDITPVEVDALTDKFSKIIKDSNGKVVSTEYWGLRRLAYKIDKNIKGHYVLINSDAPHEAIKEVERIMGFDENIIRYVTFKLDSEPSTASLLMVSKTAQEYVPAAVRPEFNSAKINKVEEEIIEELVEEVLE